MNRKTCIFVFLITFFSMFMGDAQTTLAQTGTKDSQALVAFANNSDMNANCFRFLTGSKQPALWEHLVNNMLAGTPGSHLPSIDIPMKTFVERHLRVINSTGENLKIYVKYHTNDGSWKWLPDPPDIDIWYLWDLKNGADKLLHINNKPLEASRIRIYAVSQNSDKVWDEYKNQDLWLLPVNGHGERNYRAEMMTKYRYTFQ